MSATKWYEPRPREAATGKIYWKEQHREFLARKVAKSLINDGYDPIALDSDSLSHICMPYLKNAIEKLPPDLRRDITAPSQVRWLVPEVLEMVRASRGLESKYPRGVLDPIRPVSQEEGQEAGGDGVGISTEDTGVPAGDDQTYTIPPGMAMVPPQEWEHLHAEMGRLKRYAKAAYLKAVANEGKIDGLVDSLDALASLIFEALPHLAPPETTPPVSRDDPVASDAMPIVVVAGLRRRDREHVLGKVGDIADIIFEDVAHNSDPASIGDCHWLIATGFCGHRWLARAAHTYKGRFSRVNSITGVVNEIKRLRGVTT